MTIRLWAIIHCKEKACDNTQCALEHRQLAEWLIELKKLRSKITWKPSEEQLIALDEVYKTHGANSTCRRIIFNLLEQLKKL